MSNYFSKVPNLEYVSRLPDANISDYIAVKNFFKKLGEDDKEEKTEFLFDNITDGEMDQLFSFAGGKK